MLGEVAAVVNSRELDEATCPAGVWCAAGWVLQTPRSLCLRGAGGVLAGGAVSAAR